MMLDYAVMVFVVGIVLLKVMVFCGYSIFTGHGRFSDNGVGQWTRYQLVDTVILSGNGICNGLDQLDRLDDCDHLNILEHLGCLDLSLCLSEELRRLYQSVISGYNWLKSRIK